MEAFRLGAWRVEPDTHRLVRPDDPSQAVRLEPKAMAVLVCLAERAGRVVPKEEIVGTVWEGTFVGDDVLSNAVWELRRALGDDSRNARYIETIPRKGYRLVAETVAVEPAATPAAAAETPARRSAPAHVALAFAAGAVLAALVAMLATRGGPSGPAPRVVRFTLSLSPPLAPPFAPAVALSADASLLVYAGVSDGETRLFARRLDQLSARPLAGTEGGRGPFLSPHGDWVGYFTGDHLMKVRVAGGAPPVTLAGVEAPRGAAWGDDGWIYLALGSDGPLFRIPEDGGEPVPVTALDAASGEWAHRWPALLPGGRGVLFTVADATMSTGFDQGRIVVQSLATGQRTTLAEGGSFPRYADGFLFYERGGELLATPFDLDTLSAAGPPRVALRWVRRFPIDGAADYAVAADGTLVYAPGAERWEPRRRLVLRDRGGNAQPSNDESGVLYDPRLSPDGHRAALVVAREGNSDLWVEDLERGTRTRLTATDGEEQGPVWSPDGARLAYRYSKSGPFQIHVLAADGSGEPRRLQPATRSQFPETWTPDGAALIYAERRPGTGLDLLATDGTTPPRVVLATEFDEWHAALSPDGRWLAYASNATGRFEVYVTAFPEPGARWQVSRDGGDEPHWTRGGTEIVFRSADALLAATVRPGAEPVLSAPRTLFTWRRPPWLIESLHRSEFDVTSDGAKFLTVDSEDEPPAARLEAVLGWTTELRSATTTGTARR